MTEPLKTKTTIEARQGETHGHMRWVLAVSLALAIIVLGAGYFWFMR